jgi:pyruvate ferredoxin oxidoreductase beta subunit
VPFIHSLLPGAGSLAAGIDAGLEALGKRQGVYLVVMGGDGGTVDIGLQALSGALERGHRFIYVCYDNEAYMNTGGQRSGTTPYGARTATTPIGKGKEGQGGETISKKNIVRIIAAHGIPYVATASIAYPQDLLKKVHKAKDIDGPSYIHVLTPCNFRWGFREDLSFRVAKAAVDTRVSPLLEIENGRRVVLGRKDRPARPVEEYLNLQGRFRMLTDDDIARIQQETDAEWSYLCMLSEDHSQARVDVNR